MCPVETARRARRTRRLVAGRARIWTQACSSAATVGAGGEEGAQRVGVVVGAQRQDVGVLGPERPTDTVADTGRDGWACVGGDDGRGGPCGADGGLDAAVRDGAGNPDADGQSSSGPGVLPGEVRESVDPAAAAARLQDSDDRRPELRRRRPGDLRWGRTWSSTVPRAAWRRCRHNVMLVAGQDHDDEGCAGLPDHQSRFVRTISMLWAVIARRRSPMPVTASVCVGLR